MHQTWHDLLFMHWPVAVDALRPHLPGALPLDTFDGSAWLGIVPFRMSGVRPRFLPSVPWLSAFPELNVRTYVTLDNKPGVWFFSLDAGNPIAVQIARSWFKLPYFNADMHTQYGFACSNQSGSSADLAGANVPYEAVLQNIEVSPASIRYASRRTHHGAPPAHFVATYRPTGAVFRAQRGSLEYFLTARYCLYAADSPGRIFRAEIDHPPWPLQPAEAEVECNSMTEQVHLRLPDMKPLLHFAQRIDMVAWPLQ